MFATASRFSLAAIVCAACWALALGQEPAAAPAVLLLRNGEVLSGQVARAGDRYVVTQPDSEIRIKCTEVEFVCHDLDEGYARKRAAGSGRVEDHLDLAEWCLRQGLTGYTARELAEAMALDPKHPRIALIDRRLTQSMAPAAEPKAPAASTDRTAVPNDELDRLVRGMPRGSVETFTTTIQPLLLNSCSTGGCHGPQSTNKLSLLRSPPNKVANRHVTQRNLQSVMQFVDRQEPLESPLLAVPTRPHGTAKMAIFTDHQATKYKQLYDWVNQVAADKPPVVESEDPQHVTVPKAELSTLRQQSPTWNAEQSAVKADKASLPVNPPASKAAATAPATTTPNAVPSKDAPSNAVPANGGNKPAATKAGGEYVPKDPFDPELFNRKYHKAADLDTPPEK